jgi:hypothetical protein
MAVLKSSFGLIKASPQEAADAFARWQKPLVRTYGKCLKVETVRADLNTALKELLPIVPTITRHLFFPCRNGWTVLFENGFQGTDNTSVCMLAQLIPATTIKVVENSGLPAFHYPATIWSVYDGDQWPKRHVAAMDDGGRWIFPQVGEPFAFEDLAKYEAGRIRDRFTPATLRRYLAAFSAFPYDTDFYLASEPAIRIEKVSAYPWPFRSIGRLVKRLTR